jgi:hypothetical protein
MIGMASGQSGNKVYAANKGSAGKTIQTVRSKTKAYNPNTPAQQVIRATFKFAMRVITDAVDQTIGSAVYVQADYLAAIQEAAQKLDWYGIANDGMYAGRQTFISGVVKQYAVPAVAAIVIANKVPGEFIAENDLSAFIDFVDVTLTEIMPFLKQKKKIGYLDVNPTV